MPQRQHLPECLPEPVPEPAQTLLIEAGANKAGPKLLLQASAEDRQRAHRVTAPISWKREVLNMAVTCNGSGQGFC